MRRALALAAAAAALVGCAAAPQPTGQASSSQSPTPTSTTVDMTSPTSRSSAAETSTPTPAATSTQSSPPTLDDDAQQAIDGQLRQAAWDNDVRAAGELIAKGANVNAKDSTQQSAYLIATSEGYQDLLELTLAHGGQITDLDSWQGTGLIRAAERGHAQVVGTLLRAGIARDHLNRIGYQAIHEAVWFGRDTDSYADTVRVLLAGGVQLDQRSRSENLTPLEMAQQKGFATMETTLSKASQDGSSADLLAAASAGDADGVALAIRHGANIETRDSNDRTALLLAVTADHVAVARLLVALGGDVNAVDNRSDTPWLVTGVTGSVAMVEALLPGKPDLTLRNRFGGTSLIPAAERGHVDYVKRVLETGINVNHINDLGWTALLEAVILGDGSEPYQHIVKLLLAAGADPTIADKDGVSAAEHAKRAGHVEIATLLR